MVHYRKKAIREYGEECGHCDAAENIEVHHIDGDKSNNDLDNLIPLCMPCHKKVHKGNEDFDDIHEKIANTELQDDEWTGIRVSKEVKEQAQQAKRPKETWDEYILRCSEEPSIVMTESDIREIVDRRIADIVVDEALR